MTTGIDRIDEKFDSFIESKNLELQDLKSKNTSFRFLTWKNPSEKIRDEVRVMKEIRHSLHLSNISTHEELRTAIARLESLLITSGILEKSPPFKNFKEYLKYQKMTTIEVMEPPEVAKTGLSLDWKNTDLLKLLTKIHFGLYECYQTSLKRANEDQPAQVIEYSREMLDESQEFQSVQITSREATLPDKANILNDIIRNGVSINGILIDVTDIDDTENKKSEIRRRIEAFTGDHVTDSGSRADKIYHFVGQTLHASLLQEFCQSTQLIVNNQPLTGKINPGRSHGHINLKKDEMTGEITIEIETKVYTLGFLPEDKDKPSGNLAIAADGSSLISLDDRQIEVMIPRAAKETQGITKGEMVPVAKITAQFKLESEAGEEKGYSLKITQATLQFNTYDAASLKTELQKQPQLRKGI